MELKLNFLKGKTWIPVVAAFAMGAYVFSPDSPDPAQSHADALAQPSATRQYSELDQALLEEVRGRLIDPNNPIDTARFITKVVPVSTGRVKSRDLKVAETTASLRMTVGGELAARGADIDQDLELAVAWGCWAYARQSGDNPPFQQSTLGLYKAAETNPANYDEILDRCLGSAAASIVDTKATSAVIPIGLANNNG